MSAEPRIVVIAPFPPRLIVNNAGQRYLGELARVLPASAVFITPRGERPASGEPWADDARIVEIDPIVASGSSRARAMQRFVRDRFTPLRARDGFWQALRENRTARNAIARADVIDLQWPEFVTLAPRIRRVAPNARLIATMHDVQSQSERRALALARSPKRVLRLGLAAAQARLVERSVAAHADMHVVFSDKDRLLLPPGARATVVHPPATHAWDVAQGREPAPHVSTSDDHRILSIGPLWRPENLDALEWFARDVLPEVRKTVPDATLVHAGGFDERHTRRLEGVPVDVLGFVPDLAGLQRETGVTIAPVHTGAGVKFKVLDALHDGIPIVATSVGNEGIGDGDWQPESFDSAHAFATAVVSALTEPTRTRHCAAVARMWARDRFGWPQFERTVRGLYGLSPRARLPDGIDRPSAQRTASPTASVVVPVRNGESGLPNALAALARQAEATQLEIVISDNGSTDRTPHVAVAWADAFHTLRVVDASARTGVNYARNMGLVASTTDKVLFCDHDDEARIGWAGGLIAALDRADVAGGLAISSLLSGPQRALEAEFENAAVHDALGYLPYVAGGSMGVRRGAALTVGGFDESFVKGHDEVEFCWRLQRAGYTVVGVESSVLDYRQRDRAFDAARQRFHSARTQIQLWTRYHNVAPLRPVSFRGAVRGLIVSALTAPRLTSPAQRFEVARNIGWSIGTVMGHVKYRFFGAPPRPLLLSTDPAVTT